nr:MAG TPA: hypothetical protein [Caudoviricetes sp.]
MKVEQFEFCKISKWKISTMLSNVLSECLVDAN